MSSRIEQLDAEHMRFAESAWHKLGTVGEIDYIESLSALDWADAHLDSPWFYFDDPTEGRHPDLGESGGLVQDPDTKTVVLNNYPYTHGYHSNRYKLVQHSFLTRELLPKLIQYGLVKSIESIGTYGSGEAAFVSVRLPMCLKVCHAGTFKTLVCMVLAQTTIPKLFVSDNGNLSYPLVKLITLWTSEYPSISMSLGKRTDTKAASPLP